MTAEASDPHVPNAGSEGEEAVTLEDLARAFAEATGQPLPATDGEASPPGRTDGPPVGRELLETDTPVFPETEARAEVPVTPRSILEALLFVGHPQNRPLSPHQAAEIMQGVQPEEVAALVAELNTQYEASGRPYCIVFENGGYRMKLRPELEGLREGFFGKVRHVRLSPQALEVLAIVAYKQPITVKEVNRLRGKPSGGILAQLVRRDLLTVTDPPAERGTRQAAQYRTTQRFLELFGLQSLEDLPQLGDLGWLGGEALGNGS